MEFMTFNGPTFVINMPTNWFVSATAQYQAIFTDPMPQDGFQANLMISIRAVQEEVTVKDVATIAKRTQEKEYPSYQLIEETDTEQGFKRVYRWHHPEQNKDFNQVQLFVINDNRLYTLTATSLISNEQQTIIANKIFNYMLESFRVQPVTEQKQ